MTPERAEKLASEFLEKANLLANLLMEMIHLRGIYRSEFRALLKPETLLLLDSMNDQIIQKMEELEQQNPEFKI